ncbi:MAG: class I SAM-dependent methyltransferase [Chloroflexi bacterium AL-W]|nr:class I SAM-dependent methyltransferase [Chloroflexi bacterium AL-N1]NOK71066.1 class I SAM-dependent methyltransferase [Chloroflexi bacterium AL-N10]NOK72712.1 class I SAM-dependent methyltransferase [Chloroflexi bacterium AL-N5]NOK79200.1 class I SAM-dependent methyltransferase [Chloroflexi bacterium AL-W]NOK87116.1 class I SAM-dependent methyltransferase [Chloroflexi bacterium AL-N15]
MSLLFTTSDVGKRYDQFRPKVHHVVQRWLQAGCGQRRYRRAIDVACGTGDSSLPLIDLADELVCVDSSTEMLTVARRKGLMTHQMDYSNIGNLGKFDLISTCMAFHWFDGETAINAYKNASNPGAVWLIYNFAFAGHASSAAFNAWLKNDYLATYPSPPRNKTSNVAPRDDTHIKLIKSDSGLIPIQFTKETLVGYLTTQSNIEHTVQHSGDYEQIQNDLLESLGKINITGSFKYTYTYEILQYTGS